MHTNLSLISKASVTHVYRYTPQSPDLDRRAKKETSWRVSNLIEKFEALRGGGLQELELMAKPRRRNYIRSSKRKKKNDKSKTTPYLFTSLQSSSPPLPISSKRYHQIFKVPLLDGYQYQYQTSNIKHQNSPLLPHPALPSACHQVPPFSTIVVSHALALSPHHHIDPPLQPTTLHNPQPPSHLTNPNPNPQPSVHPHGKNNKINRR